jgi:hypothetical protein
MKDADDYLHEKCARCGLEGQDRRTLWMACFYEMRELGIPFDQVAVSVEPPRGEGSAYPVKIFTMRVCKGCRSEWMLAIKAWFQAPPGDVSKWNNDEKAAIRPLAELVARLEALRTEATAVQQSIEAATIKARSDLAEREG